jgi:hypothetical protein
VRIPKTPAAGNRWPVAGNDGWSTGSGSTGSATQATPTPAAPAAYGSGADQGWSGGYPSAATADTRDSGYAEPGYSEPAYSDPGYTEPVGPPIRISGALRHPGNEASTGSFGAGEVPVVTGVPVTRQTASQPPQGPPTFDVFTPIRRPGQDGAPGGGLHENAYPVSGAGGESYGTESYGAESFGNTDAFGNSEASGNNVAAADSYQQGTPADSGPLDSKGLPRRVRQANLAPQLRASSGAAGSQGPTQVPPASAASLTDMRNTLSAMQRGWQQGRSQTQRDTEAGTDGS